MIQERGKGSLQAGSEVRANSTPPLRRSFIYCLHADSDWKIAIGPNRCIHQIPTSLQMITTLPRSTPHLRPSSPLPFRDTDSAPDHQSALWVYFPSGTASPFSGYLRAGEERKRREAGSEHRPSAGSVVGVAGEGTRMRPAIDLTKGGAGKAASTDEAEIGWVAERGSGSGMIGKTRLWNKRARQVGRIRPFATWPPSNVCKK